MPTTEEQRLFEEKQMLALFRQITDCRDRATMLESAKKVAARQVSASPKLRLVVGGLPRE
jgi:hypothetical protein